MSAVIWAVALLAHFLVAVVCSAQDTAILLHQYPRNSAVDQSLQNLAVRLLARTNGKIKIDVRASRAPGAYLAELSAGSASIALIPTALLSAKAERFAAFDVPYLFRSYENADSVLSGVIGERLLASLAKEDLVGLAFYEQGFTGLVSTSPIKSVNDMKNKRVAVFGPAIWLDTMRLYGATPVEPKAGAIALLREGDAHAAEVSAQFAIPQVLAQPAFHFTYARTHYRTDVLVASRKWISTLDKQAFTAIQTEGVNSAMEYKRKRRREEIQGIEKLRSQGSLATIQEADFRRVGEVVHQSPFVARLRELFQSDICPQTGCPFPPICCR